MYRKRILLFFLLFLLSINNIFSFIIGGHEDEIVIGKIIFREQHIHNVGYLIENEYFVIFDEQWTIEVFGRERSFNEMLILMSNDIKKLFLENNYEDKYYKIYCSVGTYFFSDTRFFLVLYVKEIELLD